MKRMDGWVATGRTYELPGYERARDGSMPKIPMVEVTIEMPVLAHPRGDRRRKPAPVLVGAVSRYAMRAEAWEVLREVFREAGAEIVERPRE